MNHSDKVFKMLGVQPEEEFRLNSFNENYKFDGRLRLSWNKNGCWVASTIKLRNIIIGEYTIRKIPKITIEDQVAIDYARICGHEWLARDKECSIYAYRTKPHKELDYWTACSSNQRIHYPVSFLSWEDEEPYYIGGDNNANKTE